MTRRTRVAAVASAVLAAAMTAWYGPTSTPGRGHAAPKEGCPSKIAQARVGDAPMYVSSIARLQAYQHGHRRPAWRRDQHVWCTVSVRVRRARGARPPPSTPATLDRGAERQGPSPARECEGRLGAVRAPGRNGLGPGRSSIPPARWCAFEATVRRTKRRSTPRACSGVRDDPLTDRRTRRRRLSTWGKPRPPRRRHRAGTADADTACARKLRASAALLPVLRAHRRAPPCALWR